MFYLSKTGNCVLRLFVIICCCYISTTIAQSGFKNQWDAEAPAWGQYSNRYAGISFARPDGHLPGKDFSKNVFSIKQVKMNTMKPFATI